MRIPFFNKPKQVIESSGQVAGQRIRAGYDAAAHNPQDERHWANADGMSADAVASPDVRRLLRNRSRYEVANNCYAAGMKNTVIDHTIGTGPRLQITTSNKASDRRIERGFAAWADEIKLTEKLRIAVGDQFQSGEAFINIAQNPRLKNRNKTDLVMIEADQISSFDLSSIESSSVDGITYDQYGNPVEYHVLAAHPGSTAPEPGAKSKPVPASAMIHFFTPTRPGQSRGIPEITPALPALGQLRRYTKATLSAAELVASLSMFMETNSMPEDGAENVEEFSLVDAEPGVLLTLPAGWRAAQIKAEQPVTAYAEFKGEILNEAGRCIDMPYNLIAGNSSNYNYASGRLDHQPWFKKINIRRGSLEQRILNMAFAAWYAEEILLERIAPSIIDQSLRMIGATMPSPAWYWDGFEHVDPLKEANAQATRLGSLTTSLQSEYARQGKDWRTELEQIATEREELAKLGLAIATPESAGEPDESETTAKDGKENKEGATNAK